MKEQTKTPEGELNDEEIANLSDAEFKTVVIRMFTDLTELTCKMKKEMKATQNKIKQNVQRNNREGKETWTQINDLEQKEEKTSSQDRMKKQVFQKMKKG